MSFFEGLDMQETLQPMFEFPHGFYVFHGHDTDGGYKKWIFRISKYIGAPEESHLWPCVRGVETFVFEAYNEWYIGATFSDHRQEFGVPIGPFTTSDQALVHLALIAEKEPT